MIVPDGAKGVDAAPLKLRVHAITYAATDVLLFELRDPSAEALPPFSAGAHVDVHMPAGITRSYSLLNSPEERYRYVIGVKLDPASRGGSLWMHGSARAGAVLDIGVPRNNFLLDESASRNVLIAGGIGITPLWCMAQRLELIGKPWVLHYQTRSREAAPLLDTLLDPRYADRMRIGFDDRADGHKLDIAQVVCDSPADAHFYCCGPVPMLKAFEAACAGIPEHRVHLEYFSAGEAPAVAGGFRVRMARSGKVISISPGQTILDGLTSAGVAVQSSCKEGVCGVCETKVLGGVPDHRDVVLSEAERREGKSVIICCSGSLTDELVLDL